MIRYHARWVLPVSRPPIQNATVAEHEGRIAYVGPRAGAPPGEDRDLGDAYLLPGLINAHTHLELTAFRGVFDGRRPFREWIITLQSAKVAVMTRGRFLDSARAGIAEGLRAGVTTYADTCDSGVALEAMREAGVRGIMFQEVFAPDPAQCDAALAALAGKLAALAPLETALQHLGVSPHAPYTVSDALFQATARLGRPLAIHLAESAEETALVRDAEGPFADGLRARGIPVAPRASSPVVLLERLGVLAARPLLIHCVRTDDADLRAIATHDCAVAHCPRRDQIGRASCRARVSVLV
jgi:cytosine/adenosine deaminase-related metal-dependent hydrolase